MRPVGACVGKTERERSAGASSGRAHRTKPPGEELLRFVRSGSIDGTVLVCPRHKSGEPHRTAVSEKGRAGYRHTAATHTARSGATPEEVAHFLGHKGSYMVKAIYAKVAVPKKVPTLASRV